ncbi:MULTISPECIES: hypothetical protein [unclassified Microcoleus]|nr:MULTISPECIES: hypothetical protein [unclassified Microcoleus]
MNSLILISPGRAGFQPILSGKSWPSTSIAPARRYSCDLCVKPSQIVAIR